MARPTGRPTDAPAMLLVHNAEEGDGGGGAGSVGRSDGRTMIPWPCKLPSTDDDDDPPKIFSDRWVGK